MKCSRAVVVVVLCGCVLSACGSGATQAGGSPSVPAQSAAPASKGPGLGQSVVVAGVTLKVTGVVVSDTADGKLGDRGYNMNAKQGKWEFTPNGWVATSLSKSQTVLGISVSVTAGSAKDLANLGASVRDASGESYTVAAALSSSDGTVVLWLFAVDRGSSPSYGPYTLLFPSGETVDIGTVMYQQ